MQKYMQKENLSSMSVSDVCSDDSGNWKRNRDDWQRGNSENPESEQGMVLFRKIREQYWNCITIQ